MKNKHQDKLAGIMLECQATILEAIRQLRWELHNFDQNVRQITKQPELQTLTMVHLDAPFFYDHLDRHAMKERIKEKMAHDIGMKLMEMGAIEIEYREPASQKTVLPYAGEYRATIRVALPPEG